MIGGGIRIDRYMVTGQLGSMVIDCKIHVVVYVMLWRR